MPVLTRMPDGPYYSQGDERAFSEWVTRIPAVDLVRGEGSSLYIHVRSRRVSATTLRELLALFRRYGVPMAQLAQFENPANREWFRSPTAHWYQAIFGASPSNPALQPTSRTNRQLKAKRRRHAARG
jgi:hypothetical protein